MPIGIDWRSLFWVQMRSRRRTARTDEISYSVALQEEHCKQLRVCPHRHPSKFWFLDPIVDVASHSHHDHSYAESLSGTQSQLQFRACWCPSPKKLATIVIRGLSINRGPCGLLKCAVCDLHLRNWIGSPLRTLCPFTNWYFAFWPSSSYVFRLIC